MNGYISKLTIVLAAAVAQPAVATARTNLSLAIPFGPLLSFTAALSSQERDQEREVFVGRIVEISGEHMAIRTDRSQRIIEFRLPDEPVIHRVLGRLSRGAQVETVGLRRRGEDLWVLQEVYALEGTEIERRETDRGAIGKLPLSEDFEDRLAEGWELEPGWELTEHPRGNWCLRGVGHVWSHYTGGVWSNFTLRCRLRLLAGGIHINYRVGDGGRYFVGVRQGAVYLNKQTGPETFFGDLASASFRVPANRFVSVEVIGVGGRIDVRIDGKSLLSYNDRDPILRGGISFETLEEAEAYVDDIVVLDSDPAKTAIADAGGRRSRPETSLIVETKIDEGLLSVISPGPVESPAIVPLPMVQGTGLKPIQRALRWKPTGGPRGGLGYDVRMHPQDSSIMYVSDAWAGVFKSNNAGRRWFSTNLGIGTRRGLTSEAFPVFCLTIDPHQPDTIWIGMKDFGGIYKSVNGGQGWSDMTEGLPVDTLGLTFRGFTVHPHDRNVVYAAAEISSWVWAGKVLKGKQADKTRGIVFRTTDGGEHWEQVWVGENLARYIIVCPDEPNVIFISTGIFDREARYSGDKDDGGVGIYRSTNGGATWHQCNTGLGNRFVGSLVMHPNRPKVLLAGTGMNQWFNNAGIYITEDRGDSWQCTLKGEVITSVEFAPSRRAEIAYAGSFNTIYRSTDMGKSWERRTPRGESWGPPGIRGGWPIDFQVDPANPDRLFANAYLGGNFLSIDGGRTWQNASDGYTGAQLRGLAVDRKDASRVLAASRTGIFVSDNLGSEWRGLNYPQATGIGWSAITVDPTNATRIIGSAQSNPAGLFRSTDGGQTWTHVASKPGPHMIWRTVLFASASRVYAGSSRDVVGLTPLPADKNISSRGVSTSDDGGATWDPPPTGVGADAYVCGLASPTKSPQIAYAATLNHGVLKTTNAGGTWQAKNTGLPSKRALSVAIAPENANRVYVGLDGAGLYVTSTGGGSWGPAMAGLDANSSITSVVFDPKKPNVMYAADRKSGVYRYDQIEQQWIPINLGLANREVNVLVITADGRYLYAGTEGTGVFRLDLK